MSTGQQLEVLDRQQCIALLQTVRVGRLVFTEGALPAVQPVNFRMHRDDVVIRVAGGAKLAAATSNCIVAFQADALDADLREGWSVTVVGHANLIVEVDELVEVAGVWLQPWVQGRREHFVRIRTEQVTGRILGSRQVAPPESIPEQRNVSTTAALSSSGSRIPTSVREPARKSHG